MYPSFYDMNAGSRSNFGMAPETVQRVQFTESGGDGQKGAPVCGLVVGIIILLIVFMLISRSGCAQKMTRVVPVFVNGMKAKLGGGDKDTASSDPDDDIHIKLDKTTAKKIKKPGHKGKGLHNLTPCSGHSKEKCQDTKKIDPSVHKETEKNVRDFLAKHPVCMVMVFAPWCPHCHTAMPEFAKAAEKSEVPFALINAEMMDPKLLQGESALFNVQYFPYILRRETKGGESSDTLFKDAPKGQHLVAHSTKSALQYMFG